MGKHLYVDEFMQMNGIDMWETEPDADPYWHEPGRPRINRDDEWNRLTHEIDGRLKTKQYK